MTKQELIKLNESLNLGRVIIICTNYSNYMLINKTMVSKTGFMSLSDYDNNLNLVESCKDFEINEIWETSSSLGFNSAFDLDSRVSKRLLWKREQFVELTMDEIAKKFGINVNQLKIKNNDT